MASVAALTATALWGAGAATGASRAEAAELVPLVEDYAYPDRDKILQEKGLKLISGDGGVLLADCSSGTDLIRINSRANGTVCFTVTRPVSYLALEIKQAYLAKSDDRDAVATLRTEDTKTGEVTTEHVDLPSGKWTSVGEGVEPDHQSTVLELATGKGTAPVSADPGRPWLARVAFGAPGRDGGRGCTGALVDRMWVLTAAGCFTEDPQRPPTSAGPPAQASTVVLAGHAPVAIEHLVPRDDRDVVLARLAGPITDVTPATVAAADPAEGAALATAGYGRTDTAWVPTGPHTGQVTVTRSTVATLGLDGGRGCAGDAGGPVMNGSDHIVAVQSRATAAGCLGQTGQGAAATAALTSNIGDWLRGVVGDGKALFGLGEAAGSRRALGGPAEDVTATLYGGAALGVPGKSGSALQLNGTNAYAATAGPVVDTTTSFSVAAWVKLDNLNANYTILSQAGTVNSGFQLYYSKYYNKWIFNRHTVDKDPTEIVRAMSTGTAQAGVWTHLVGSYDAANQTVSLFVNGQLQQSAKFTTPWRARGGLQIGRLWYKSDWQEFAFAAIDQVQAVQSAATAADAQALRDGGQMPRHLQELASFSLDERPGSPRVGGGPNAGLAAAVVGDGAQLGVPGRIGTGLRLDGASAYAATAGPVVDTGRSFSVSVWARLDRTDGNYTVLSQAGAVNSGFQVYYSKYYNKWIFNRHTKDADGTDIVRAMSLQPAQIGVWTHLTGVYDSAAQQIKLYVDDTLQATAAFTTPWRAEGGLQIGRLRYGGAWQENFAGTVDEVQVWDRAIR